MEPRHPARALLAAGFVAGAPLAAAACELVAPISLAPEAGADAGGDGRAPSDGPCTLGPAEACSPGASFFSQQCGWGDAGVVGDAILDANPPDSTLPLFAEIPSAGAPCSGVAVAAAKLLLHDLIPLRPSDLPAQLCVAFDMAPAVSGSCTDPKVPPTVAELAVEPVADAGTRTLFSIGFTNEGALLSVSPGGQTPGKNATYALLNAGRPNACGFAHVYFIAELSKSGALAVLQVGDASTGVRPWELPGLPANVSLAVGLAAVPASDWSVTIENLTVNLGSACPQP